MSPAVKLVNWDSRNLSSSSLRSCPPSWSKVSSSVALILSSVNALLAQPLASTSTPISNWGEKPTGLDLQVYVPAKLATNQPSSLQYVHIPAASVSQETK